MLGADPVSSVSFGFSSCEMGEWLFLLPAFDVLGVCLGFSFLVCNTGDASKIHCIFSKSLVVVMVVVMSVLASGIL